MNEMTMEEEKNIIAQAKTDYQAFDYLYEKYMPAIFRYVMYRVYNQETAEDIVSTVFYKAMKNISLFKWRKIPFSAWLYRIAFNEICNHAKKEKKKYKISNNYQINSQSSHFDTYHDNQKSFKFVHKYLKQLPIKDQDIITLRYFERKPFSEIAEITGKNESTLRVNLHRALKRLQEIIPEEVYNEALKQISM
ncbi:MAG: sigma-70 family RNA polymerase sigma factor [Candidatus Cloacimonadales bacterium]|jgi:RNA polymerase sigma-70 factor (ECF subfamily)|nr:sigma-70 family RNA polymerase sigma factor [Candidatus Cloacimonadota bacterium]MDD2651192.1 sigma-70 family RNA polymerase sigma factor [Candidatus Cloacimonadota bacterium]MDD3501531.1 sigma-70 family RNA polymerase sigma factor [Candidatus Cloacimonadota bacterium]MDX9977041.1 sigma-70 family RNA polymerase sigma factor [Candidatus Cloacimonadales bacterium]